MRTLASYGWPYKSVDMQEVILDWKNSIKPVGAKNPATQPQRDRQKRTEDEIKQELARLRRHEISIEDLSERARKYKLREGRKVMWLRNYKLTEWMVKKMLKSQGGKCAICRKDLGEDVCVDHNHISQAVRGILCTKCNCRLGAGWDDPNWAIAAAVYLKIIPKPVDSGTTGA